MTNLDGILKSRDITLPTMVCAVKAMFFPVVMYGCESRTIKKASNRKIDAFELWCWGRLLRILLTEKRSKQLILREISPDWKDWCWNSYTSATWCEELTHWKIPCCWERLKAGGEGDDRGWDGWMASLTQWNLSKFREIVKDREAWCAAIHGVVKNLIWLSNWTVNTISPPLMSYSMLKSLRLFI